MPAHHLPSAGLDFGTSTTLYANSRADVIPIGAGGARAWMPSLIGFPGGGARVLAEQAESLGHHAPASVLRSVKRYITRGVTSVGAEGPASAAGMSVDHLIADLLREAWARARSNYATLGTDSVLRLGCPAMWDGRQRSHLLAAAQQAGVPVGHAVLIDEPIAAGIAWLASRSEPFDDPKRIVVFDMGGGTLDIAVLHVQGTKVAVLAAHGRGEAGDKLDQTIAAELQHALVAHGALRGAASKAQAAEILRAAREVKEGLSDFDQQPLTLDPRDFPLTQDIWYTRAELEQAFAPQMDRAQHTVERALRVARVSAHEAGPNAAADMSTEDLVSGIDYVVLSGGMSKIPYVRERLQWMFGPSAQIEEAWDNPEEAVVVGLARAGEYRTINAYRASFDILLEWDEGRISTVIYEAYTPVIGGSDIAGDIGNELRYVRRAADLRLPSSGKGVLRLISQAEEQTDAVLDGRPLDGYPVELGSRFEFSLYPDGKIRFRDQAGLVFGHISDWYWLNY